MKRLWGQRVQRHEVRDAQAMDDKSATSNVSRIEEAVGEFEAEVEAAVRDFSSDIDELSGHLGAAAAARREASEAARTARMDAIDRARRLERESLEQLEAELEQAETAFHAKLDEMREDILRLSPVTSNESNSPPTKRAAYSDRTAALMAKLSLLAYDRFENGPSEEEILTRKLRAGGLELVGTFNCGGTQGFVCENDKLAVLVFRGTTDVVDWKTNLKAKRVVIKNNNRRVRAHEGFLNAYLAAEHDIIDLISRIYFGKPIYIAGHSLGGALAVVASAAIPMEDELTADQIAAVYSYGAPRAGGGDFRELIKVPHYRVFNPWDIVPSVPPVWASFQHTGDVRYLAHPDRKPAIRKSPLGGFMSLALLRSAVLRLAGSDRTSIKQHDIKKYVTRLESIARARNKKIRAG